MSQKTITYCTRCVNVSTRPDGITFDAEGLCTACQFSIECKKYGIDYKARRRELNEILAWGKANSKSSYDCIVTVSGGKDSTRQAFFARDELGLKPLLVSSIYPPEQQTDRGAHNLGNLISHGFDTIAIGVDPQVSKKFVRQSFFKYGNLMKPTEFALYAIPIHVAIAYKIPLIFLGENSVYTIGQQEGRSQGGNASGMRYSHTLQGGDPESLMFDDITRQDTFFYRYPPDDEIEYANLKIIYLGYYIPDWSELNNAKFSIERGLQTRNDTPERTGQLYSFTSLDEDFYPVNQMIKYIKFGFGATTDQVCAAINQGIMDRKKGFELVKKYDGKCDHSYIERFCKYIGISHEEFWKLVESYRNHHLFEKDTNGKWKLKAEFPEA